MYIYIYIYACVCIYRNIERYTCVYIYIYIERERDIHIHTYIHVFMNDTRAEDAPLPSPRAPEFAARVVRTPRREIYIYIYIYIYVCTFGRGDDTVGNPHRAQHSQFELFRAYPHVEISQTAPCRPSSPRGS